MNKLVVCSQKFMHVRVSFYDGKDNILAKLLMFRIQWIYFVCVRLQLLFYLRAPIFWQASRNAVLRKLQSA
jgi:hypothetical protein